MRRAARFFQKRAAHIFCSINRITVYKSIIRRFIPQSKHLSAFYTDGIIICRGVFRFPFLRRNATDTPDIFRIKRKDTARAERNRANKKVFYP